MEEREVGGLRCSEVLADLSEYVNGELDEARVAAIDTHLAGCSNCERFGASFAGMVSSLRQSQGPAPLPAGLMERIRDAVEEIR